MPVRMFGSGTGDGVAKVTSGLGDAFLGYLKQQAQEPLMQAQALKMKSDFDTNAAQQGKLGQETQILQNKAAWQAEGLNLPNMTPDQKMNWALRGHAIGEDPQRFVKGLASGEFFRAAQPGAQAMPEDRARNLGMALGHFASQNSAYTVPYQQEQQGKQFAQETGLEGMRQAGQDRRATKALDSQIVPIVGPEGPTYVTRRDAIGKTPAQAGGGRPIPTPIQKEVLETQKSIINIDDAINELKRIEKESKENNYSPTGFVKGIAGSMYGTSSLLNAYDPEGVPVRAKIANIGSLKVHDRSGAAVTAVENPRLIPFIPSAYDTPGVAIKKLEDLKREAQIGLDLVSGQYSQESGYRPMNMDAGQQPAAKPSGGGGGKIRIDANGNIIGGR